MNRLIRWRNRLMETLLRDCRRESPVLEGGDESPSSSTFSANRGFRCPPNVSPSIRRGTSAPTPGQSDKFGFPDRGSMVPHRDRSGTDAKQSSTSESGTAADRSNGRLARPAPRRCANLKPSQTSGISPWESSPFRAGRRSSPRRRLGWCHP